MPGRGLKREENGNMIASIKELLAIPVFPFFLISEHGQEKGIRRFTIPFFFLWVNRQKIPFLSPGRSVLLFFSYWSATVGPVFSSSFMGPTVDSGSRKERRQTDHRCQDLFSFNKKRKQSLTGIFFKKIIIPVNIDCFLSFCKEN